MRAAYDVMPRSGYRRAGGGTTVGAWPSISQPHTRRPAHRRSPTRGCRAWLRRPSAWSGPFLAHRVVGAVGVLTWAVAFGALATNLGLVPHIAVTGLRGLTRRLLRIGIVLLGFSLSLASIAALGVPVVALVVVTLLSTLVGTVWAGRRLGLGRARSLLVATGFAICGASAIAAMEETAEADDEDVALAVAMVTLCGTARDGGAAAAAGPLRLTDTQYGTWAGASVHEVGQVVAAAGPAGAAAVGVAVVVKLTRVLLLAPVVAGVGLLRRHAGGPPADRAARPPLVPLFVLGLPGRRRAAQHRAAPRRRARGAWRSCRP